MKKITLLSLFCLAVLTACPSEQTSDSPPATESAASAEAPAETPSAATTAASPAASAEAVSGDVQAGAKVFTTKTCTTCHKITGLEGAVGVLGPALDGIGSRAATRVQGMSAEAYLRQSIEEPGAHLVEGFQNVMTPNLKDSMSDKEYQDLLAYLLSLKS